MLLRYYHEVVCDLVIVPKVIRKDVVGNPKKLGFSKHLHMIDGEIAKIAATIGSLVCFSVCFVPQLC